MKIMDVDNGHQQLLKASGEKLVGEKQCGISEKTESRLMEQKKKSGNGATPQGHLIYNKDPQQHTSCRAVGKDSLRTWSPSSCWVQKSFPDGPRAQI